MTTYRLRATGLIGVLLPVLLGLLLVGTGADAVIRAGGPLAWILLVVGLVWTLLWLRLPWAIRLADEQPEPTVTFLAPLRRTQLQAGAIESVSGQWTGGMNRWFLASVWVEAHGRAVGMPLPVGFADPEVVRDHLLQLNPTIRMDR